MSDFNYSCPVQVRYSDLDALGHVNNAVYFSYIELARIEYLRSLLQPADDLRPGFVLASARCDFRSPAYYGEQLTVAVRVARVGNSSFDTEYRITGPAGRLVAEAHSVQVCIGPDGRSTPLPAPWRERLVAAMQTP